MNRHIVRGKIKRATCWLIGHVPRYEEFERDAFGSSRRVVVKTLDCSRCGHLLEQTVEPLYV